MLQLYTFLSTVIFLLFLPLIALAGMSWKKYRGRTLQRLGLTLTRQLPYEQDAKDKVIWIHALSVGEVTSALPLLHGIRRQYPQVRLYFSTTTSTGQALAKQVTEGLVDAVFFSPFDCSFSIQRFIKLLAPSLFIQVETDFWPGWLYTLNKNNIPCLLVNGRFSEKSLQTYRRFSFLFQPMFNCFTLLSMQTDKDGKALLDMGLKTEQVTTLGNLKYDSTTTRISLHNKQQISRKNLGLEENTPLIICGSTHKGEEEIIFAAFREIRKILPACSLLLAPRDINRTGEIEALARKYAFQTRRRSMETDKPIPSAEVFLLDTLGELNNCYELADVALIGGSLVAAGGHNPLEAAAVGIPILFGPHMEDFAEISRDLLASKGAKVVADSAEFAQATLKILTTPAEKESMGSFTKLIVLNNQGVVKRHLIAIEQLLSSSQSTSGNG